MPETITSNNFLLEKYYSISAKSANQQFSKMVDSGNIEVPESSSSPPVLLQEQLVHFGLSVSKSFKKKNCMKRYLQGFSKKCLKTFMQYKEHFLKISEKKFGRFYVIFVELKA